MTFEEAIDAYYAKFNDLPPVVGMDESHAIEAMEVSIQTNTRMIGTGMIYPPQATLSLLPKGSRIVKVTFPNRKK